MNGEGGAHTQVRADKSLDRRFAALQGCFFAGYAGTSFFSYLLLQKGVSNVLIGMLGGLMSCVSTLVQPVWGLLCDRRRCYRSFYLLSAAAMLVVYTWIIRAGTTAELAVCAALSGMFINCIQNMGNGWVAALNAQGRAVNYGVSRSCGSLAFAIMAVALGWALERFGHRGLVGGMTLAGLCCAAVSFTIPRPKALPRTAEDAPGPGMGEGLRVLTGQREYMLVVLSGFFAMAGVAGINAYFSAYLAIMGAGATAVGVGNFAYAIAEVPFMFLSRALLERFSFRRLFTVCLLAHALQCVLVGLSPNYTCAILAMLLQGLSFGTLVPCLQSYTAGHVDARYTAMAQLFTSSVSLSASMVFGSLAASLLSVWLPLPAVFLALSLLPLGGGLAFWLGVGAKGGEQAE